MFVAKVAGIFLDACFAPTKTHEKRASREAPPPKLTQRRWRSSRPQIWRRSHLAMRGS